MAALTVYPELKGLQSGICRGRRDRRGASINFSTSPAWLIEAAGLEFNAGQFAVRSSPWRGLDSLRWADARGQDLGPVTLTMFLFGIGTAVPLLLLSLISRATLMRWRGRMTAAGKGSKQALGGVLVVLIGVAILFGLDRTLMTALVRLSPPWLDDLSTRF
jgi:hypothetical protein